jgi:hypothetical protein
VRAHAYSPVTKIVAANQRPVFFQLLLRLALVALLFLANLRIQVPEIALHCRCQSWSS